GARVGRRGASRATACGAHHYFSGARRPAGRQPRDGLRRAPLLQRRTSAGGAPAPRRPAARTTTSAAHLGRRGPSPATACGAHNYLNGTITTPLGATNVKVRSGSP